MKRFFKRALLVFAFLEIYNFPGFQFTYSVVDWYIYLLTLFFLSLKLARSLSKKNLRQTLGRPLSLLLYLISFIFLISSYYTYSLTKRAAFGEITYVILALTYVIYYSVPIIIRVHRFISSKTFNYLVGACLVLTYFGSLEFRLYKLFQENGGYSTIFCSEEDTKQAIASKVIRIIGSESQGSGFFINPYAVLTNNHVVYDEVSPKVILPSGKVLTPTKVMAFADADLALLTVEPQSNMAIPIDTRQSEFTPNERIIAFGYPLGTEIKGNPTIMVGNFLNYRNRKKDVVQYIQTNIGLIEGMSGGPAVDRCGNIVGINTLAMSGMSFLIRTNQIVKNFDEFADVGRATFNFVPGETQELAVRGYYLNLQLRNMQAAYGLLSKDYLLKTDYPEWLSRFTNIIDVYVYSAEPVKGEKDLIKVKFSTNNWIDGDTRVLYYEGTWQTIFEDGKYKLLKSKISEVIDPDYKWFYEEDRARPSL